MSLNAKIQYEQVTQTIRSLINMGERARRWCLTFQNITDEIVNKIYDQLSSWISDNLLKYGVRGIESAPSTNNRHMHLYLRFKKLEYRNFIKSRLGSCWLEQAKGSEEMNYRYITKDGNFKEYGELGTTLQTKIEKDNTLERMLNEALTMDWNDFEAKYPLECYRNRNKIMAWIHDHTKYLPPWDGDLKAKNIWLWGKTGVGKSKWAHQQAIVEETFVKNASKWWDGYKDNQVKLIIIEDFPRDSGNWLINIIKIWCDRYGFDGEIKGGTKRINPGKWWLIVTCNHPIDYIFQGAAEEDVNAVKRRFTELEMTPNSIIQWTRCNRDQLLK